MATQKKLVIGLFGFGVVGEGIYHVINTTFSDHATIKKICIRDAEKKRNAPQELFTSDYGALLYDPEINVIIELIDDAVAAYTIVCTALSLKKAVVSANKKMIAENLPHLLRLQKEHRVPFLYEAAVCGSIPIIRNLEEYYDNDLLQGICGIVNGSTNYILTKISEENLDYSSALSQAQSAGFAETSPLLDVQGIDAVNKLTILLLHGYGIVSHPGTHLHIGITRVNQQDVVFAHEKGMQIKLIARAKKLKRNGRIAAFVLPQFITSESQLHGVRNEYNGVVLQSGLSDKQFLYGKGAGRYPTSSAVLSDVSALRYEYKYEYRKCAAAERCLTEDFYLRVYVSFNTWADISTSDFEWVEEFHARDKRQYLLGVIHFQKLKAASWLNSKDVSIIVCPEEIIECVGVKKAKTASLRLAGIQPRDAIREGLKRVVSHTV